MSIDTLGGYRILRKLGEGRRAEVFLAHTRGGRADRPVVIKVFRAGVAAASITAEIEALSRAAGPHTMGLTDVTTAPDGSPALLLERVQGGSLTRLLHDRAALRAGEAITLLAPLASACARMHRSGVVHAGLRPEAVLFDSTGAPVLACFGRAYLISPELPPALLDDVPGVAIDIDGFAALSLGVMSRVADPSTRALSDWIESSPAREHSSWFGELESRLFALAEPLAIDFAPDLRDPIERLPQRALPVTVPLSPAAGAAPDAFDPLVQLGQTPPEGGRERDVPDDHRWARVAAAVNLPDWAQQLPADVVGLTTRLRAALSRVRARVWVAAGAVGVALAIALMVVPHSGDSRSTAADPAGVGLPQSPQGLPTTAPDSSAPANAPADEPLAALIALLDARQRCLDELSVLCLDAVDQSGSAALADDQTLVRGLQAGEEQPVAWGITLMQLTVSERLGDSVIVDLGDAAETEPASILMMRSEAGWRIRDYLER